MFISEFALIATFSFVALIGLVAYKLHVKYVEVSYLEGFTEGEQQGHFDGFTDGETQGYEDGLSDFQSYSSVSYETGFNDGLARGLHTSGQASYLATLMS